MLLIPRQLTATQIAMSKNETKKRDIHIPLIEKSLSVVLASMQGETVQIELKNDDIVIGTVETVGHGMDIQLQNVSLKKKGRISKLEIMFILGEHIRLVHIPSHLNVTAQMNEYMKHTSRQQYKTPKIVDRAKKVPTV